MTLISRADSQNISRILRSYKNYYCVIQFCTTQKATLPIPVNSVTYTPGKDKNSSTKVRTFRKESAKLNPKITTLYEEM